MAQIKELAKKKQYIESFLGYNRHDRIDEKQAYDCYNVSNREFPILCSREPRGIAEVDSVNIFAMASGSLGLAKLYSYGENLYAFTYGSDTNVKDGITFNKNSFILSFGTKMILLPQMISTSGDGKFVDEKKNAKIYDYALVMYEKKDDTYTQITDLKVVSDTDIYKPSISDPTWFVSYYSPLKIYKRNSNENGLEDISENIWTAIIPKNVKFIGEALIKSDILKLIDQSTLTIADGKSESSIDVVDITYQTKNIEKATLVNAMISANVASVDIEYGSGIEVENTSSLNIDYAIECQNRIWACRYGENVEGENVNEIYATELGTSDEWMNYTGDAAASYSASIGTPGAFTGAAVLGSYPYFFKEKCVHKIYVSSSGAHQIRTLDIPGVENGSYRSIVNFGDYLIYKGCDHVYLFDGSGVLNISDALGNIHYKNAIAGRSKELYVMYCEDDIGNKYLFTYNTNMKLWQKEIISDRVTAMCEHNGELLMALESKKIISHRAIKSNVEIDPVRWMWESGEIGFSDADHKYICRLDFRVRLGFGSTFNVWIQYDSDDRWISVAKIVGDRPAPKTEIINIMPRRCEHFKFKIQGRGDFKLYTLQKIYEEGD